MLSEETKQKLYNLIFERAYEIEQTLSENNFLIAKLAGLGTDYHKIQEAALMVAIKELKKIVTEEHE